MGWRPALLASALCACAPAPRRAVVAPPPSTAPARLTPLELSLTLLGGETLDVSTLRGRAVLIAAVQTENLASQALLRNLERLARAHPDALAVIAVVGDPFDPATAQVALQAWRDVLGLREVRLAPATDAIRRGASELGPIERAPTLFFLNRAGAVARRSEGYLSESQLEALVAPALPPGR